MSDEGLIESLRKIGWVRAADYIEELEADRRKTYEALLKVTRIHEEVEAKLAKIVAIVRSHDTGDMQREDMEVRRILQRIEAELTGGKDE